MSMVIQQATPLTQLTEALESSPATRRLTQGQLDAVYALGYNLYSTGKYEGAANYFAFLTLYAPTNRKYLRALGAAQQMSRRFAAAIQVYDFLTLIDPADPEPTLRTAECQMLLGRAEEARRSLTLVVKAATAAGQVPLKARAEGLLEALGPVRDAAPVPG